MKKYVLFTMLINFPLSVSAQSLLELEKKLDNKDRVKEYDFLKTDKIGNDLLDFNRLGIFTNVSTSGFSKDNIAVNGSVNYAMLSYSYGYEQNKFSHSIGVSKTINDYFYNRFKENDINYQLDLMKVKEKYDLELFNKIDLIKKYLILKNEKQLISQEENFYKTQLNIVEIKNNKGYIAKVDYNFIKNNYNLILEKLKIFDIEMENILNDLKLNNISLEDIKDINKFDEIEISNEDIEKYVLNNDIKLEKLEIDKLRIEDVKNKVNEIPKIDLSFQYNINEKKYDFGVGVSKNFNLVTSRYSQYNLNKEKLNKREEKINILTNKKINDLKLEISRKKYELNELKLNIKNLEMQVDIINKKFELGMESFVSLLNKKNELLKNRLNLVNKEIDFEITKLKIKKGLD